MEELGRSVYSDELYCFMEGEAKYRILLGFAANRAIPKKIEGGWYTLVNQSFLEKIVEGAKSLFHNWLIRGKLGKKGRPLP